MKKATSLLSLIFIFSTMGCDNNPVPIYEKTVSTKISEEKDEEERKLPIEISEEERTVIATEQEDEDLAPKKADVQQKTLEELKKESEALKKKLAIKTKTIPSPPHFVVVGSFKTQEFQHKMEIKIKREKLEYQVVPRLVNGQRVNTIKIGPLQSSQAADDLLSVLKTKNFPLDSFVE